MSCPSAYVFGALDVLVKAGEVSPAYAAGVASVLAKQADYTPWWDSNAQNLAEEWEDFYAKHRNDPAVVSPGTGPGGQPGVTLTGDQAKQILRDSRHWWTDAWGRTGDAVGSFGSWLGNKLSFGAKSMSWEDMKRMHAVKQNRRDLAHLQRLQDEGAQIPAELYGALQDQHTQDMAGAWDAAGRVMSPDERARMYGEDLNEAKDSFRTAQGTAAISRGAHKPAYDSQSVRPLSIHDDPLVHAYGSKDRQKVFSQTFRNGLGMY